LIMSCAWDRNSSSITTKTAVVKWQGQYDINKITVKLSGAATSVGRQHMGHLFNPCLVKGGVRSASVVRHNYYISGAYTLSFLPRAIITGQVG
jgi:hypothetical protein